MALLPKVKLKVVPTFPASIYGGTGIEVTKANGSVTVDLDYSEFGQVSVLPSNPNLYSLIYDTKLQDYVLAPVSLFGGGSGGSGIADAPIDGFQYGRNSAAWTRVPTAADAAALITLAGISPVENIWFPACDITGAIDSGPIIQAAVDAAQAAGGGVIVLPATGTGHILVNTSVIVANGGIHIRGFGYEEFRGYQAQYPVGSARRGTTGTYIHTTVAISPFVVRGTANGCKISDMAFTQTQPASAPGWGPASYPPTIDHSVNDMPNFNSSGGLEVYNILFAGIYAGIQSGTSAGTAATTSKFAARDYFHHIKGTFFSSGILVYASSDTHRIENFHFWPGFYENMTTDIGSYVQENAYGIGMQRNDNGMLSNIFIYGTKYGLWLNGGNADGIPQGIQVHNLDCDTVHIGIYIDNIPSPSVQNVMSVVNYAHNGVLPIQSGDLAIWIAANTTGVSITINNANLMNYGGTAVYVQGTTNEVTINNCCAYNYSNVVANSYLVSAAAGCNAYLYGRFRLRSPGSSPGKGNPGQVIDHSD